MILSDLAKFSMKQCIIRPHATLFSTHSLQSSYDNIVIT